MTHRRALMLAALAVTALASPSLADWHACTDKDGKSSGGVYLDVTQYGMFWTFRTRDDDDAVYVVVLKHLIFETRVDVGKGLDSRIYRSVYDPFRFGGCYVKGAEPPDPNDGD